MQDNIISFSTKIKKEMLLIQPLTEKEIISELYGIFLSKDGIIKEEVNFKTEISYIAKRVLEDIKKLKDLEFNFSYIKSDKITSHNMYNIQLKNTNNLFSTDIDDIWLLKGIFLGNGYVKDPQKGYSMDFFLDNDRVANMVYDQLKKMDKKVFLSKKKEKNIVYIRNNEDILDLLVIFGAVNTFFSYQDTTINKEISLKITRNMNYEIANETKKIATATEQIRMINKIKDSVGLENLNNALREVAIIRLENEDLSLSELAEKLNITKSGIRNRFRRLKEIYEELEANNAKIYFKK
ncbi:DNA-binding protein WhiA [uncultured Sneathia sp.]|uniref:DNA-binding protein WhiA n=1 Tax=uncultured Sneathia sp. TaxID=278067 RepID=UPI0025939848|nr:DNA-binding protein WhiA [uncultured Sneathia sp.]